jgi:hypothetical protein
MDRQSKRIVGSLGAAALALVLIFGLSTNGNAAPGLPAAMAAQLVDATDCTMHASKTTNAAGQPVLAWTFECILGPAPVVTTTSATVAVPTTTAYNNACADDHVRFAGAW